MNPPWTVTTSTAIAMTAQTPSRRDTSTQLEVARLVEVVAALREHCPWTAALTHQSLTTYVLEEAHELIEAIEAIDAGEGSGGAGGAELANEPANELANELGDLLLQVVLHARLGEEAGSFDLGSVAAGLSAKLIRRSPHVFHPDGSLRETFPPTLEEIEATWEQVKAQERAAAAGDVRGTADAGADAAVDVDKTTSPFAGIPAALPALAAAHKTIERAQRAGMELPAATGERPALDRITDEAELGRLLFEVVQAAHSRGLDAERALRHAVREVHHGAWPAGPEIQAEPGHKV